MNEADRGKVVYRGEGRNTFRRFVAALVERGNTDEPLVVEVHRETALVPLEPRDTSLPAAYSLPSPVASTVPMLVYGSGYRSGHSREYGRNSSLGDRLLDAYAMTFELLDALWSGVKGRILLKA